MKRAFTQYFIPHDGNDNKPLILRPTAIAFVVMVALVAESAFVFSAKYLIPQSKLFGIVEANTLIDETNQNRVANDLPALAVSPLLQEAAQEKATDMATKGYFAHTSPQGLTPWYWFQQVGYNFDYAGENLAVNFSDSQDVTDAWMNSPEHRANILSSDFTQIGIATAQGIYNGAPATYVVEEFGAPAAAPVAFVDTASAASAPSTAPIVTPTGPVTTTPAKTAPAPKAPAPKKTPVAPTSVPTVTVPAVVAMQSTSSAANQSSFVAIQGASAVAGAPATSSPVSAPMPQAAPAPAPQSNLIQALVSNPKNVTDGFYAFLIALFLIALGLNVFVNIRVQYPRLIMGGLLVIVIAGLCIMLNQNIGLLHTAVI